MKNIMHAQVHSKICLSGHRVLKNTPLLAHAKSELVWDQSKGSVRLYIPQAFITS